MIQINLLTLHMFVGCSRLMLRDLIYVRMFDKFKSYIEPGFAWPKNKGKLQEAINGEYNLITLAHSIKKRYSSVNERNHY